MRFAILIAGVGTCFIACQTRSIPKTSQPAEYADAKDCAVCHAKIAATYQKTGMARSFYQPSPENTVEDYTRNNRFYHQLSDTWFAMLRRDGKYYQRRWQRGADGRETNVDDLQIDYVMGSGNHVRTYLHRTTRGTLIELPLGWYPERGGTWAMNPGYEGAHLEARRKIAYECMFCHNAYPQTPAAREEPVYHGSLPEGIDCQRCHGPGAAHVRAARAGAANVRQSMVNPARLTPERQMEVCMQCHLQTTAEALPSELRIFGRTPFSYRAGEPLSAFKIFFDQANEPNANRFEIVSSAYRLRQSQCFLKSAGKLVCETCHNPHDTPRGAAAVQHYDGVCRQCHGTAIDGLVADGKHPRATDCASCHMPKRRTSDVPHAIMTDHLIQRRPSNGATATATTYQGEVVPYYPSDAARADPLTVAAAQVVNNSNLTAGIPRLSGQLAKGAQSAEAYVILGDAWRHSKRPDQAAPAYEQAAKLNPASTRAQRSWGVALKESGQFTQAAETLKRAVQQMPEDPENWYELGLLDSEQGRPADAIAELQKAVALDPDLAAGYNNLGGNLAALGRMDEAQTAFREALRIDPYDASAHANLGQFLASTPAPRGSAAQAAEEFAKAVKLQPENARNRYLYGIVLAQLGHLDEARKQLEAALQADPKLAPAHELLGRFLEQSRNLDAALREYGEAVEIQPDFGRAHLDIAAVLAARGDLSGAASQLKMAAAGKDPAAAQEAVAGLRQLEEKRVR